MKPFEKEICQLIVKRLELDIDPESVGADEPLFIDGLGLDSIDALEISLILAEEYGVKLSTETENVNEIFSSIASLTAYVEKQKGA